MRVQIRFEYFVENGRIKKKECPSIGLFISYIHLPVMQDSELTEMKCGVILNDEWRVSFVPSDKIIWPESSR